jgi:hypothetical protein
VAFILVILIHELFYCFQTDPQNTDYSLEDGATRNFEAAKTAEKLAILEQQEKEDEEANNPMKVFKRSIVILCFCYVVVFCIRKWSLCQKITKIQSSLIICVHAVFSVFCRNAFNQNLP